jgi:hypothetical protein
MGASIYANINGVTRKGKKLYAKVNGVVRPIKEAWVKTGGVNRCVYKALPTATYRVTYSDNGWYDLNAYTVSGKNCINCSGALNNAQARFYSVFSDGITILKITLYVEIINSYVSGATAYDGDSVIFVQVYAGEIFQKPEIIVRTYNQKCDGIKSAEYDFGSGIYLSQSDEFQIYVGLGAQLYYSDKSQPLEINTWADITTTEYGTFRVPMI